MICTCCKTPLSGGTDTFGWVGQEMCQWCFLALCDEKAYEDISDKKAERDFFIRLRNAEIEKRAKPLEIKVYLASHTQEQS